MNDISEWVGVIGGIVGFASFVLQNFIFPKTSRKEHVKDILLQKSEDAFNFCFDYWVSYGDEEQKRNMETIVTKKLKEVTVYYTENKKIFGKSFDVINDNFIKFEKVATGDTFGSTFSVKDSCFIKKLSKVYMEYRRSLSFV